LPGGLARRIIARMPISNRALRYTVLAAVLCCLVVGAVAQAPAPPSAEQVLAAARTQAASQHKAIFLIFYASW